MAFVANTSKWKLGGAIWIAGMIGVLAVMFIMLPVLISQHPPRSPLRVPVWVASLAASAQAAVLLALFVWCGAVLASRVGLRAPVFEALVPGQILGSRAASTALARPPRRVDHGHNSVVFHLSWSDL